MSIYVRFSCDLCAEQLDGYAGELEKVVDLVCDLGAGWEVIDSEMGEVVACPECVAKKGPPPAAGQTGET